MKLTEKQKIEIYQKRKQGTPIPCLSLEYGINKSGIKYGYPQSVVENTAVTSVSIA